MVTEHVYMIRQSVEPERPVIDFQIKKNGDAGKELFQIFQDGRTPDQCGPTEFVAVSPDAADWDLYSIGDTLGLFSQRAMNLLGPYARPGLHVFQATLNGAPYYFLREKVASNFLDRDHSELIPFQSDPASIKEIRKFSFHKDRVPDPIIFVIPEIKGFLFGTDSITRMVNDAHLRGFDIVDAETWKPWE